jgi:hypothetical protein
VDWDDVVRHALASFHEGFLLSERHPSLAAIGFVAALEGLGSRLVDLRTCPECHSKVGSGKRFRAVVAAVRPEDESREIARLYTPRSETAHSGILHGTESSFGVSAMGASFFGMPADWSFVMNGLWRLREAARDALRLAFEQGWPPADAF